MSLIEAKAHSVLFPVLEQLELNSDLRRFLDNGGRSLLFGETGDEYRSGQMSASRLASETLERWQCITEQAKGLAGPMLLAADADISAVHRLQGVTPALPEVEVARVMNADELEAACFEVATAVREAGINLVLSPTADVLNGANGWLEGRTLSNDVDRAAAMVAAYVRGVRRARVSSTLKHFPGHPRLVGQPAIEEAVVSESLEQLRAYWPAFKAGVEAGADAVMMGPAIFSALQPPTSASLSPDLIGLLRNELDFSGVVMTIDLDHRSVMRNASLGEVAVAALNAGADLLLLSARAVPQIPNIVADIMTAVARGTLPAQRLDAASAAVWQLARRHYLP
jgi:beta-N-acetylhexosaminidase